MQIIRDFPRVLPAADGAGQFQLIVLLICKDLY